MRLCIRGFRGGGCLHFPDTIHQLKFAVQLLGVVPPPFKLPIQVRLQDVTSVLLHDS